MTDETSKQAPDSHNPSSDSKEKKKKVKEPASKSASSFKKAGRITQTINNTKSLVIIAAIAAVMVAAAVCFINRQPKPPVITVQSSLDRIVEKSDLNTFRAVYNGVVPLMNKDDADKVDAYVSYEAVVKAGIEFSEVSFKVDEENRQVTVYMPVCKVNDIAVNHLSLDYMFLNKKMNQKGITAKALKAAMKDVEEEIAENDGILRLAETNAKNVITGFVAPFLQVRKMDYNIVFETKETGK